MATLQDFEDSADLRIKFATQVRKAAMPHGVLGTESHSRDDPWRMFAIGLGGAAGALALRRSKPAEDGSRCGRG